MSSSAQTIVDGAARGRAVAALPPEKLLPDSQPAYVASWIYVFGVLSLARSSVIIVSGMSWRSKGPTWWHFTGIGHFFNSIHLWSVELFFFFMVIHLWGKYWMAAWRGGRAALDHRCGHFPGRDPVRAHRLCLPAELRRAVDLHPGQGRDELRRDRRVLQPHELRPDVQLPRPAAPGRRGRAGRAHVLLVRKHGVVPPLSSEPTSAGPMREPATTRRRQSHEPRASAAREDERLASGRAAIAPMTWSRSSSIALGVVLALARRADDPVLVPGRAAEHDQGSGRAPIRSTSSPPPSASSTGRAAPATYGPPYNHNGRGQQIGSSASRSGSGSATRSTPRATSSSPRSARSPASPR